MSRTTFRRRPFSRTDDEARDGAAAQRNEDACAADGRAETGWERDT